MKKIFLLFVLFNCYIHAEMFTVSKQQIKYNLDIQKDVNVEFKFKNRIPYGRTHSIEMQVFNSKNKKLMHEYAYTEISNIISKDQ